VVHCFSSTQIKIPTILASSINYWVSKQIPGKYICFDPKTPSKKDLHITVLHGIRTECKNKVAFAFRSEKQFELTIDEMDLFTDNLNFDVLVLKVVGDDLYKLYYRLANRLKFIDIYSEFKPHITIAYLQKNTGTEFLKNKSFAKNKIKVEEILFSSKNGEKFPIKLGEK
jgi:2'-5' RNA ligase